MTLKDVLKEFNIDSSISYPKRPNSKKFNKFYWWRRFPAHQSLHKYKPLIEQIKNGDFDYSPYWAQANWEEYWMCEDIYKSRRLSYIKGESLKEQEDYIIKMSKRRIKRLREDAMKDEYERIESFKSRLKSFYGGKKELIDEFILNFEGTLEDAILRYPKYLKEYNNKQLNNKFELWGI